MKKISFKSTLVVAVLAVSAAIGYVSYNQYQNQQLAFANPLMEENIEALADDGTPSQEWYLHTFNNCENLVVDAHVKAKALLIFNAKVEIGANFPVSNFTQYFNHIATDGQGPCEKGEQITCNGVLQQLRN